ncbi:Wzz/FepE/Etk N-terminal domain-containing protein [Rhodococcus sp. NPDC079359]|uniref:Wzz/FepE/Etk N-terminal domain-containing protein n=1 Tax=Rhodococcus sp. NPDC079359 TaxID=3154961 RepID=UPI00344D4D5B
MNSTLTEYFRILTERWRWVAVVCLVVVGLAATYLLLQPKSYQSQSTVFVSTPRDDSDTYYRGDLYAKERLPSYAALIQSQDLARRVIADLQLDSTPEALIASTTATPVPGTVLILLSTAAGSPSSAQAINQAYLDEFMAEIASLEAIPGALTPRAELLVVEPPTSSELPGGFPPTLILGAATAAGLIAGATLAVLLALADSRIRRPEDAIEATGLPLFAAFPAQTSKTTGIEPGRQLRDALQAALPADQKHIVLVTAPDVSTGSTSIAQQLADSLRDSGESVALIDFDVRTKPSGTPDESVVSVVDVVEDLVAPDDALSNKVDGISVVPQGHASENAARVVDSPRAALLIERAAQLHGWVILDSAPASKFSDAQRLSHFADALVIVSRSGKTKFETLRATAQQITLSGQQVAGVVLNGCSAADIDSIGRSRSPLRSTPVDR